MCESECVRGRRGRREEEEDEEGRSGATLKTKNPHVNVGKNLQTIIYKSKQLNFEATLNRI